MNRCPITYEACENRYSLNGLQSLSPKLTELSDFPFGREEQLELAFECSDKLSFSGVQPKLNAKLNLKNHRFEIVTKKGSFILKLPHAALQELPQNEDLTMKLAKQVKIKTPLHGMFYAKDNSLIYFVRRFDREGKKKFSVEDFAQLAGLSKESKYDFSMEKLIDILNQFSTFPSKDKELLFRLTLFNFLVGNEDMHLKNFSMIRKEEVTSLAPAYDLINSTIVMNSKEEIALPLNGKKSNLKKSDFFDYFGNKRLGLSSSLLSAIASEFESAIETWQKLISISFLSQKHKESYLKLLKERFAKIF
ncbi:MAG TPA: HipA domain-containing protein [Chlamydiales bacterium]|nr:HipA domain-containing protein [Chlamydiales bacterium]